METATTKSLSDILRESTKEAHHKVGNKVIRCIKSIKSEADYAAFLKLFYAFHHTVEKQTTPYITEKALPDLSQRRDSSSIQTDLATLGYGIDDLKTVIPPFIDNTFRAMGARYVLEGSAMGGPYIIQMLRKRGIERGFSFYEGYGEQRELMWERFGQALDYLPQSEDDVKQAVEAAVQTFDCFFAVVG